MCHCALIHCEQVAGGYEHSLAVTRQGKLYSWGGARFESSSICSAFLTSIRARPDCQQLNLHESCLIPSALFLDLNRVEFLLLLIGGYNKKPVCGHGKDFPDQSTPKLVCDPPICVLCGLPCLNVPIRACALFA